MKVEKIEVFLTAAVWRNFLFVKLTPDDGVVAWGDGTLEWKESTVRDLILDLVDATLSTMILLTLSRSGFSFMKSLSPDTLRIETPS